MQGEKRAVAIVLRKLRYRVELHAQRSGVRRKQNVGNERHFYEVRHLSDVHGIVMLADVAERPAIESAVFHGRHVIRHQIVAEIVALIDGSPERVCAGLPRQRGGIPQSRRKDAETRSIRIVFADRGSPDILTFVVIRSGADGDVHLLSVLAEGDVTSEVIATSGDVYQWFSLSFKVSITGFVRIANNAVGISDVYKARLKRHAVGLPAGNRIARAKHRNGTTRSSGCRLWSAAALRRHRTLQKDISLVGGAVVICVAQHDNGVCRSLRDKQVTVWGPLHHSWALNVVRIDIYSEPCRHFRHSPFRFRNNARRIWMWWLRFRQLRCTLLNRSHHIQILLALFRNRKGLCRKCRQG